MIIDDVDASMCADLEQRGVRVVVTDTIMRDADARRHLATAALEAAEISVTP